MLRPSARGEMAEQVEGAPLLREYGVKSSIEGSNPSLSAIFFVTAQPRRARRRLDTPKPRSHNAPLSDFTRP